MGDRSGVRNHDKAMAVGVGHVEELRECGSCFLGEAGEAEVA